MDFLVLGAYGLVRSNGKVVRGLFAAEKSQKGVEGFSEKALAKRL